MSENPRSAPLAALARKLMTRDERKGALSLHRDAPTKKIEDWRWNDLPAIPQAVDMTTLPSHVVPFGDFMVDQARKADTQGLSPRDVIKAYTTTRSSIQRQAVDRAKLEALGLPVSSPDQMIRPEGAFADWLMTPLGKRYLDAAVKGNIDLDAIENAGKMMRPFGFQNALMGDLVYGAKEVPDMAAPMSDLVAKAYHGMSTPQEWREFMRDVKGIGPAKSGFMSSMIGRGDNPTLDARQLQMHTGTSQGNEKYMTRSSKKLPMTGGDEAVERLSARQRALGVDLPSHLEPYYQHLVHHGMWDAASGTKTTHQDIMDMMRYRHGGSV